MRKDRLVDKTSAETQVAAKVMYSPNSFETISLFETIPKSVAIEAVVTFFETGVFTSEIMFMANLWWKIRWLARR